MTSPLISLRPKAAILEFLVVCEQGATFLWLCVPRLHGGPRGLRSTCGPPSCAGSCGFCSCTWRPSPPKCHHLSSKALGCEDSRGCPRPTGTACWSWGSLLQLGGEYAVFKQPPVPKGEALNCRGFLLTTLRPPASPPPGPRCGGNPPPSTVVWIRGLVGKSLPSSARCPRDVSTAASHCGGPRVPL